MLGVDIGLALPELQAQAGSLMVDTCTITRAGADDPDDIDEDTGIVPDGQPDTIYSGKCRLQAPNVQPNTTDAGETEWNLRAYMLQVPASVTGVEIGDAVSVTSTLDADVLARSFTVAGVRRKTHQVWRVLALEEVS